MHGRPLIQVTGKGPELVMIHGWGMHKGIWGAFAEQLSRQFRLHLVDLPGHGEASRETCNFNCAGLAKYIASQTPPAIWLGWSLGGQIAIKAALEHSGAVKRLILLSTNPSFVKAEGWECAEKAETFEAFSRALENSPARTLDRFNHLQLAGSVNSKESLRIVRSLSADIPALEALRAGLEILRSENQVSSLSRISVPCLLAGGSEDRIVPFEAIRQTAMRIPDAQFHELQGAGHLPFFSHQEALSKIISQFASRKLAA